MDKLTDDEMYQLKTLLVRYLAYHAQGVFNMAVAALLVRFKPSGRIIDISPVAEPSRSNPPTKRKRAHPARDSN
jgi:hypothetical protein